MSDTPLNSGQAEWGSRFGYLMVAAGASIGLGNIWKFPYLAYRGGGGIFMLVYIIIILLLAKPMVELETAIGRHTQSDCVTAFAECGKKKAWGLLGWIGNLATIMICAYYFVVGGWVIKYAVNFIVSGDFGSDPWQYFTDFTSSTVEPLVWALGLLAFTIIFLFFGITNIVEKMAKVMLPALFCLLIICGVYACTSAEGAMEGLKYYLMPDFSNFSVKVAADAVTQCLFSVGIGWSLFVTLGANLPKKNNLRSDAIFVSFADTVAAIVAGFVIIPAAFGAGVDVQKGPSLIFGVLTDIFGNLPGGRIIGAFFFTALIFAVISSLFSFVEITARTFEINLGWGRKKGLVLYGIGMAVLNILVSLGFGVMSDVQIPWAYVGSVEYYGLYDWFDCFSGYVLLPLGCLLTAIFPWFWGWDNYEKEVTNDGKFGKISKWDKIELTVIVPFFMLVVLLNVFGVIK
ncbi:MAG: sodium-dependent transporter [Clostridiales bacterium]|nr:sodium-dependent transporter [Candidatus Crickella equi]